MSTMCAQLLCDKLAPTSSLVDSETNFFLQEKGLSAEYVSHRGAHRFIRKLLCLPFLPAEHIGPVFESMADLAPDRFDGLLAYIRRTWIDNDMWPVHSWSVFGLSIRTNNDVEGKNHILKYYDNIRYLK
jgi:hypothetical protein